MKIEAIEELYEWGYLAAGSEPCNSCAKSLMPIIDRLKSEIDERFIELPVDADNLTIHIDDTLIRQCDSNTYIVKELRYDGESWWYQSSNNDGDVFYACENAKHKPRTLEDILESFAESIRVNGFGSCVERYADEIRSYCQAESENLNL